ncbi:MAG: phosphoenolpyruvate carboxykinase (ATP) [Chitinophagaceae bacterium]
MTPKPSLAMQEVLHHPPVLFLKKVGIPVSFPEQIHYQTLPNELILQTLDIQEGELSDSGALVINTGKFTGRSPKDRFIVKDDFTSDSIDWNEINQPISPEYFEKLYKRLTQYFRQKELWVRDSYVCSDPRYRMNLRVVTEKPWASLFSYNMFLRPKEEELDDFKPEWIILHAPGCMANRTTDGTRQENFVVINFTKKIVLIGGTAYTGEIKKGIFSVLNFILPHTKKVLSMHCSANVGEEGDTALFFGLSGTGKTTLSTDSHRRLIGDDEHGWSEDTVFNFEGGCYAKCIDLCREKEPQIYDAIKPGALVENTCFKYASNEIDFTNKIITENTRVSYPVYFLKNIMKPSVGDIPKNIFFLTCDAYGVLPPVAKLTPAQALYQFISGYTAKIAGTEAGINEPKATFSACYGAPFLPLNPTEYARMLGDKIEAHDVHCWLINTGWTGGAYGTGSRMKLSYTRAMISAAFNGYLDKVSYEKDPIFGLAVPMNCPGVPVQLLHPRNTWAEPHQYDEQACKLAQMFIRNFEKYNKLISEEVLEAAPKAR